MTSSCGYLRPKPKPEKILQNESLTLTLDEKDHFEIEMSCAEGVKRQEYQWGALCNTKHQKESKAFEAIVGFLALVGGLIMKLVAA